MASVAEQLERLTANCVDVVTREDLTARLTQGRPLRVKLGIDPSGPMLHLGHAVVLRQLRAFQDLGHTAVLVVGDFTAQIGDPTGRVNARKPRTPEQIRDDMRSYADQASLILDIDKAEIRYNSEWLGPLRFSNLIGLLATTTVARMLERDDFSKRYGEGAPIGLHEFMYPISQAYDSVMLNADVELGGTEQLFNLMMGRRLQEDLGNRPQICMTLPILEGTDGVQRMGKSLDNFIALREQPAQMFGKIMSLPDALLERYWRLATDRSKADADKIVADIASGTVAPRDAKIALAETIVRLYHGEAAAKDAREHFERTIVRKEMPTDIPVFELPSELRAGPLAKILVAVGFASSGREAQRLIKDGAIKVDGARVDGEESASTPWTGKVLQKGNHRFVRLT
ncbi:MAG TPA: tyrosine--tRNA ligase [Candidatus Eremiobacteraceae bacterium]|nr:tyrosine--tRNA ligase [Candidatus Eremiobacteraceae bacterium]